MHRWGRGVEHGGLGHGEIQGQEELSTVCTLQKEGDILEMYLRREESSTEGKDMMGR